MSRGERKARRARARRVNGNGGGEEREALDLIEATSQSALDLMAQVKTMAETEGRPLRLERADAIYRQIGDFMASMEKAMTAVIRKFARPR